MLDNHNDFTGLMKQVMETVEVVSSKQDALINDVVRIKSSLLSRDDQEADGDVLYTPKNFDDVNSFEEHFDTMENEPEQLRLFKSYLINTYGGVNVGEVVRGI